MTDELIDIIDENGIVTSQIAKSEAHTQGLLHKTVIGYVRDGDSWTLVRQTPDRQDAGQLVAPVGGHVKAGESDMDALLREAEEEIGTRNITAQFVGKARFHRQVIGRNENHLFLIYEISTDDPMILGDEAEATESFTTEQLKRALEETPEKFGEAMYFVLEKFYHDYLPTRWSDRWQ